jgi:poly(beta-D-mannuronate) lyase
MGNDAFKSLKDGALVMGVSVLMTVCALPATATEAAICAPAPPPVQSLSIQSRYEGSDASRATLNKEVQAETKALLKPLDDFLRDLSAGVETMLKSDADQRPDLADCLLQQMAVWAEADALSDLGTQTTQLTIGARLAGLAIVATQAALYATDPDTREAVGDWLSRRVGEQMRFWEIAPRGAASGNLRAWAGLAAAATTELNNDPVMRSWAIWSTSYVLCSVNSDGSLPQEMGREKFALHYQLYALSPLVTSIKLLERQGILLFEHCDGALERAVHFALSDLETGAQTEAITGHVQSFFDGSAELKKHHLAWLEAYLSLTSDPLAEEFATARRPLSFSKLGGNQTLIWGHSHQQ